MLCGMSRRWRIVLIQALVIAQALLATPVLQAMESTGATHEAVESCPCCPEGTGTIVDCLAGCTLGPGVACSLLALPFSWGPVAVEPGPDTDTGLSADPPVNPPPIA